MSCTNKFFPAYRLSATVSTQCVLSHDVHTEQQIDALHQFDCLRANKSTSAWGVEPRVPFLDVDFLDLSMNIDPNEKMIKKVLTILSVNTIFHLSIALDAW
jgi:asparagine synthetase B (glutamine-hydrolysing)